MQPQYETASAPAPVEKSLPDTNGLALGTRSSPRDGHRSPQTGPGHRLDEGVSETEPPAAVVSPLPNDGDDLNLVMEVERETTRGVDKVIVEKPETAPANVSGLEVVAI